MTICEVIPEQLSVREYERLYVNQAELIQYALGQGRKCVNTLPYGAVADNKLFDFNLIKKRFNAYMEYSQKNKRSVNQRVSADIQ